MKVTLETEAEEELVLVRASWNGQTVGICKGLPIGENRMLFGEIMVENSVATRTGAFARLFNRAGKCSFRRRGVGTLLLQEFLKICVERGMHEVICNIVRRDLDATPDLLAWYAKRGFRQSTEETRFLRDELRVPHTVCEIFWHPSHS